MKITRALFTMLIIALFSSACSTDPLSNSPSNYQTGNYATGISQSSAQAGAWDSNFLLQINPQTRAYGLLLRGTVTEGSAKLEVQAEDGRLVWQSAPQTGAFQIGYLLEDVPDGIYQPVIRWEAPLSGTFDLYTVPGEPVRLPVVQPTALMGGIGMILVSMGFLGFAWRSRLPFRSLALGALFWILTVAVKFIIAIPLNPVIFRILAPVGDGRWQDWVFSVYIGLLTGITEVLIVWWALKKKPITTATGMSRKRISLRMNGREWRHALAFGIGFGVIEALILGFSSFSSVVAGLTVPEQIPLPTLNALAVANHPLVALAPVWERFFTIFVHIACNVLLFYGAVAGKNQYFWISFWFKTGLDSVAGFAQLIGIDTLGIMWLIEGIIGVFGLISIWGIMWVRPSYPQANPGSETPALEVLPPSPNS